MHRPIPYSRPSIHISDIVSIIKVLFSYYLTQGRRNTFFQTLIAKYTNSSYCLTLNSATSALHAALFGLGISSNDIVWTTPITFVASANCARYLGAHVDFVDVIASSGLICVESLRAKLENARCNGKLPRCLVVVHLYGNVADMKSIYELSQLYGFYIVEDASHAFGSFYYNKPIGDCYYSDAVIFSFHAVKNITTAEGGCITTNNHRLFSKASLFLSHGITKDASQFKSSNNAPWDYEQHLLGFNYRMTELQAALGISQFSRLHRFKKARLRIIERYRCNLANLPLKLVTPISNSETFNHLAVIRLDDASTRLDLYNYLLQHNVFTQVHYIPVHLQPYYRSLGFDSGYLPVAEDFSSRVLSLPLFVGLTNSQVDYISNLIIDFYS